jgi:hypothetical protein
METALEILKYTIPAFIVFLTAYFLVNSALNHITKKIELERKLGFQKETLPLRLQAYERLAIFLERNQVNNLAMRLLDTDYSLREFQGLMISTVRAEFEHNLSQQLYVSGEVWLAVRFVKDDAVRLINMVAGGLPPEATSKDLARVLIETGGQGPAQKAIEIINQEIKELF